MPSDDRYGRIGTPEGVNAHSPVSESSSSSSTKSLSTTDLDKADSMQLYQLLGNTGSARHVTAGVAIYAVRQHLELPLTLFAALRRHLGCPLSFHHERARVQLLATEMWKKAGNCRAELFHQHFGGKPWCLALNELKGNLAKPLALQIDSLQTA
ncbi:unnamed protein product [Peronospora destructor]|uniref:Uncharacterized protein n=1 Tax=Peronospora destructor TaxID=86335 RepID=A0AAV0UDN7_9STRA|nr:unnamed protein product [Peronospora destructor]